jgi:hypothetical protein
MIPKKRNLKDLGEHLQNITDKQFRAYRDAYVTELYKQLLVRSPVKSGQFRGNWRIETNGPLSRFYKDSAKDRTGRSKAGSPMNSREKEELNKLKRADLNADISIGNNAPYAAALEYGRSRFAPAGVAEPALVDVASREQQILRDALRKVK